MATNKNKNNGILVGSLHKTYFFMKLHIAFDITDLDKIEVASKIEIQVPTFKIGSLLLYKYGTVAIGRFQNKFPKSPS